MYYWYELVLIQFSAFIIMHYIEFNMLQGNTIMLFFAKYLRNKKDKK